ncbi:DUF4232 domain-containing protein [Pandoraea bronchicola]|uniref:DUF4232 domain-containing protein n=1 Tax=Pandoraea bronchicola TaxID=2508287 RepID=A0A5E5BZJ5_9BURK|nr:hypothetical protein PBR20603_04517 [Pandoraea bronchicola]
MKHSYGRYVGALLIGSFGFAQISSAQNSVDAFSLASCTVAQVSVGIDDNGELDGMSHAGVVLTVKNTTSQPCALSRRPEIEFQDRQLSTLQAAMPPKPGMFPGPVEPPLVAVPGQRYTSNIRWVSSSVYDKGRCIQPVFLALWLDGGVSRARFSGQLCGANGAAPIYTVTPFEPN